MIKAIDAFPPLSPGKRPKCQAKLSAYVTERNEFWRKKGTFDKGSKIWRKDLADDQCGANARYVINGKWYCRKHGALTALDLVAEKIPTQETADV